MPERITDEDYELLGQLGVESAPSATGKRTAREQRIIAGFEDILRFVEEHRRPPQHGESRDIFERLYAVRLDRIRESAECLKLLEEFDSQGLLKGHNRTDVEAGDHAASDKDLLDSLGVEATSDNDIAHLVHVRSREEIKAAEEIAKRAPCENFEDFKPIFEKAQDHLKSGIRQTVKYEGYNEIKRGDMFILEGQKLIVAEVGEEFVSEYDRPNRRLRVVYDNGTESDPLLRSLQRALYEDKTSRRIAEPGFGPLFAEVEEEGDLETGYVYVVRSKSDHPFVIQNRDVIHKIGVTGGDVKSRIGNAKKDPTYLLADVEIVATYKLANVNRKALEALLQKFFAKARLDLELKDRFGSQVEPREWFLLPLTVIDEAIQKLKEGSIGDYAYEPESAMIIPM